MIPFKLSVGKTLGIFLISLSIISCMPKVDRNASRKIDKLVTDLCNMLTHEQYQEIIDKLMHTQAKKDFDEKAFFMVAKKISQSLGEFQSLKVKELTIDSGITGTEARGAYTASFANSKLVIFINAQPVGENWLLTRFYFGPANN